MLATATPIAVRPFVRKLTDTGANPRDDVGNLIDEIETPEHRMHRLLSEGERIVFQAALQMMADALIAAGTEEDLATAIENGREEEIIGGVFAVMGARMSSGYNDAFTTAGERTAEFLRRRVDVAADFDIADVLSVEHMRGEQLRHIREISTKQREAIDLVLADGFQRNLNPRVVARNVRSTIGLTAAQERAVRNFRAALERIANGDRTALRRDLRDRRFDRTLERHAKLRQPLTVDQMDRMEDRYRSRMLRHRVETIARTEALRAVHTANDIAYRQAVNRRLINVLEVQRTWWTAEDERVRSAHARIHGVSKGLDEVWETEGGSLRFPGDPLAPAPLVVNCRCVLLTSLVSLA